MSLQRSLKEKDSNLLHFGGLLVFIGLLVANSVAEVPEPMQNAAVVIALVSMTASMYLFVTSYLHCVRSESAAQEKALNAKAEARMQELIDAKARSSAE